MRQFLLITRSGAMVCLMEPDISLQFKPRQERSLISEELLCRKLLPFMLSIFTLGVSCQLWVILLQLEGLRQTINRADVDIVLSAIPIDLAALITVNKPILRIRYDFAELGKSGLADVVEQFLHRTGLAPQPEREHSR